MTAGLEVVSSRNLLVLDYESVPDALMSTFYATMGTAN